METWIVIGAVAVAVAPRVPGLREAAKAAVRGGMKVVDTSRTAAANAGEHWADLVAEAKDDGPGPNGSAHPAAEEVKVPVTSDGDQAA